MGIKSQPTYGLNQNYTWNQIWPVTYPPEMVLVFPYLGLIDLGSIGKPVLPLIVVVDNE